MKDILSPEVIDQIRLSVKVAVKSAINDVFDQLVSISKHENAIKDEEYLSAAQAAKFLKIRVRTVYSKCVKGELPFHRVGKGRLLFNRLELVEYINR